MPGSVYFWRRTEVDGFERLELDVSAERVEASSTVLSTDAGGYRIDHSWTLDAQWSVMSATVERWSANGHGVLRLERDGAGWRVNGERRTDLNGAAEPDLSVTPFCNTFPIRRTPKAIGSSLPLDTAFIDGPALTVVRSRQRYDRKGQRTLRYVDLGVAAGFEADLIVDADGMVVHYEHLFERILPMG